MKFNSQICTSREQSERLLELGLKKETADMNYTRLSKGDHWTLFIGLPMGYDEIPNEYLLPAWSLHRLWCLLPNSITIEHWMYARKYAKILDLSMDSYQNVSYTEGIVEPCNDIHFYANDAYESICKAIEWLIKEGYFNKEYLEEQV
jgi:hypothetical protein